MKNKTLLLLLILSLSLIPLVKADSTQWYDTAFQYRNVYSIDSSLIDEELTDFPVLIYLNSSYVDWEKVNDDLSDIYFVDYGNTLLSHEIDDYTVNSEAWLWVKIPTISNIFDTRFFMYYGFGLAESVENKEDVWDSNFKMVQHMNDNPDTSHIKDSTSNDNDGTKKAANEPIEATGKIEKGQSFDKTDDYINLGTPPELEFAGDFTISAWAKVTAAAGSQTIIRMGSNDFYWRTNNIACYNGAVAVYGDIVLAQDTFYLLTWAYDSVAGEVTFYINDTLDKTVAIATAAWGAPNDIGRYSAGSDMFGGVQDELTLSSTLRSVAWVGASYETQTLNLISLIETETYGEESLAVAVIALMISLFSFVMVITYRRNENVR